MRHPVIRGSELISDLHYDYLALTGRVAYPHRMIFIAGLPKAGTSWLEELVGGIPGYVRLNNSLIRTFKGPELLSHPHGVNPAMLSSAPARRYSYLKLHTHFMPEYVQVLTEFNVRPVILIRDLRDMMISRYHHIMSEPTHWMYESIKDLDFAEGFKKSLNGINPCAVNSPDETALDYYKFWLEGWVEYIRANPDRALLIRYEAMRDNPHQVLDEILRFHEIYFDAPAIDRIIERQARRHKPGKSLSDNLRKVGRQKSTFRKGQIGEWQSCFTEQHKAIFKKKAGNVLILSGYEKDLDW